MQFTLKTCGEIVFGDGVVARVPAAVQRLGSRALLVTGRSSQERSGALHRLRSDLETSGVHVLLYRVKDEPTSDVADEAALIAREDGCDVVVAIGGGSVLDTAKAAAALATNGGSAVDYLEDLGAAVRPVDRASLPVVAVPTTSGSGSEVTRNSVLRVTKASVKRSMRADSMIPKVAVVDPELARAAPRSVAASAGLDALTHLIEAYVSKNAQPTTDALALEGVGKAASALQALADDAVTADSARAMSLASLWGGLALANAGLGAVHGLVASLGGRYAVPHGAGCGCLLAATLRVNVHALRTRAPASQALGRYDAIARAVAGDDATAEDAADALDRLRASLGVGGLASYGVPASDLGKVIEQSRGSSMRTNPIDLTDAELDAILRDSLGAT